jgi:hypothetical protein
MPIDAQTYERFRCPTLDEAIASYGDAMRPALEREWNRASPLVAALCGFFRGRPPSPQRAKTYEEESRERGLRALAVRRSRLDRAKRALLRNTGPDG